jgi:hypothetical protein
MFEQSEFTVFSFMNEINNKPFYWKSSKFISQLSYNLQDLENYFSEKGRVT